MIAVAGCERETVPGGQPILDLARDASGNLLAVTVAGVFRRAGTWMNLLQSVDMASAIAPTAVHVAADGSIFAGVVGGVLTSTDAGETWSVRPFRTPAPTVSTIASIGPEGIVLAGTLEDGVFRSDDHGVTWTSWNFGLFDRSIVGLGFPENAANDVVALTGSGCFVSANTGKSWTDVPLPDLGAGDSVLACVGSRAVVGTLDGQFLCMAGDAKPRPIFGDGDAVVGIQALPGGLMLLTSEAGEVAVLDRLGKERFRQAVPIAGGAGVVVSLAWAEDDSVGIAFGCTDGALVTFRVDMADVASRSPR